MTQTTQERPNYTEQISEAWMQALSNVCWAQDQGDKIVTSMLEQGRVSREEGLRLADRIAGHVRQNQEEMQKWIQGAVQMSMAAFKMPSTTQVDELTRKVDELTRKVEALSKKA